MTDKHNDIDVVQLTQVFRNIAEKIDHMDGQINGLLGYKVMAQEETQTLRADIDILKDQFDNLQTQFHHESLTSKVDALFKKKGKAPRKTRKPRK